MGRFFIALTFPSEWEEKIDKLRSAYDPKSISRHPPHLTLVAPFNYEDAWNLQKSIQKISTNYPALQVEITAVAQFPNHNRHHLEARSTAELLSLRRALLSFTKVAQVYPGFVPHITLGYLDQVGLEKAGELVGEKFLAKGVYLFEKQDASWKII